VSPSSVFRPIFTVFLAFHLSFFRFCFWINLQWPPPADKLRVQGKAPLSLQQLGELSLSPSSETPPPHQNASSRTPAWTGARGSPTYSPSTASPRQHPTQAPPIQNSFPPLAQINGARPDNPRDRVLQSLSGLTVCSHFSISVVANLSLPWFLSRVRPSLCRLKLLSAMRV
jgi:hypothetical protein